MNENQKIRIMIVDDHIMVRKGLIVLLEEFDDLEVVGEAGDGESAVTLCSQLSPQVILMDMAMPRLNGLEAIQEIKAKHPEIQILVLTSFSDEEGVHDAIQAGAIGYLLKNITGSELANAVRKAAIGKTSLAPEAAEALIQATIRPPAPGHDLTSRERDVLKLMIEGFNNREIGEKLFISSSTVKNHVSKILGKLETTSRTQAVAIAVEKKILS